jgi:uncharacterized protein (DUF433 family)
VTNEEQQNTSNVSTYSERIVSDPRVLGGEPIVRGTRIPVEVVLEQLALDPDPKALFLDYPRLTTEDVRACLEFARSLIEKEKHRRQADPLEPVPAPL